MGKSRDNEPRFSFAMLAGIDNYKKWAQEIRYSFESRRLWDHTLSDKENPKPVAIIFKGEALNNDAKLERQKKHANKILAWTKNNIKYKDYISRICLDHIE